MAAPSRCANDMPHISCLVSLRAPDQSPEADPKSVFTDNRPLAAKVSGRDVEKRESRFLRERISLAEQQTPPRDLPAQISGMM